MLFGIPDREVCRKVPKGVQDPFLTEFIFYSALYAEMRQSISTLMLRMYLRYLF